MSILLDKPTIRQPARKSGGVKLSKNGSVFLNLKSPNEIGRIYPKLRGQGWTETSRVKNIILRRISGKVVKLYREFLVHQND